MNNNIRKIGEQSDFSLEPQKKDNEEITIDEIFRALQGEGLRIGCPSIFIRLAGCNLTCAGFGCELTSPIDGSTLLGCDTIHAVNKKHFSQFWKKYDDKELIKIVKDLSIEKSLDDIVISGGEPLLQHKNKYLILAVENFVKNGHAVFFETNGTIDIDFEKYPIYKKVSFSISPKMENSGEPLAKRWKPKVVRNYLQHSPNSYLKFVLNAEQCSKTETKEVEKYIEEVEKKCPVYIMPQGETKEHLEANAKEVYEFALTNGYRYTDRIHIRMYGDKRGV